MTGSCKEYEKEISLRIRFEITLWNYTETIIPNYKLYFQAYSQGTFSDKRDWRKIIKTLRTTRRNSRSKWKLYLKRSYPRYIQNSTLVIWHPHKSDCHGLACFGSVMKNHKRNQIFFLSRKWIGYLTELVKHMWPAIAR